MTLQSEYSMLTVHVSLTNLRIFSLHSEYHATIVTPTFNHPTKQQVMHTTMQQLLVSWTFLSCLFSFLTSAVSQGNAYVVVTTCILMEVY